MQNIQQFLQEGNKTLNYSYRNKGSVISEWCFCTSAVDWTCLKHLYVTLCQHMANTEIFVFVPPLKAIEAVTGT